jgi:hypothetical protein
MKTCPIIMSAPMVHALLEGHKTQTRRIIKPQPVSPGEDAYFDAYDGGPQWNWWTPDNRQYLTQIINCPYGKSGDLLWAREMWKGPTSVLFRSSFDLSKGPPAPKCFYKADVQGDSPYQPANWKSSIHMPRWASRLTLELTDVRVERLQDISEDDAKAEGLKQWEHRNDLAYGYDGGAPHGYGSPRGAFHALWESIHGVDSWNENLWVWVLTFRVHHCNIDEFIKQKTA